MGITRKIPVYPYDEIYAKKQTVLRLLLLMYDCLARIFQSRCLSVSPSHLGTNSFSAALLSCEYPSNPVSRAMPRT